MGEGRVGSPQSGTALLLLYVAGERRRRVAEWIYVAVWK